MVHPTAAAHLPVLVGCKTSMGAESARVPNQHIDHCTPLTIFGFGVFTIVEIAKM